MLRASCSLPVALNILSFQLKGSVHVIKTTGRSIRKFFECSFGDLQSDSLVDTDCQDNVIVIGEIGITFEVILPAKFMPKIFMNGLPQESACLIARTQAGK